MRLRHIALFLLVAVGAGIVGFYIWLQSAINLPGPLARTALVYVEPNTGTKRISADLLQAGDLVSVFGFLIFLLPMLLPSL